jgi:hypothetical protein
MSGYGTGSHGHDVELVTYVTQLLPCSSVEECAEGWVTASKWAAVAEHHAGSVERLCRNGIFAMSSSLGIRFLTSNFPFSTRLM